MRCATRVLAIPVALALGCAGSNAIVARPDAPPLEAEIDSSDATALRLRGPSGNLVALDQYHVSEIDHPGNVWGSIGLFYVGSGALLILPAVFPAESGGRKSGLEGFTAWMGVVSLLVGIPMALQGWSAWGASKSRAHAFESARPPAWMIPPAMPGMPEPIEPLRPPSPPADGTDDEDPDKKPPPAVRGFHR